MLAFHYRPCVTPYAPPTWADGTDAEIAEAVAKADAGEIDLSDYWSVGDERTVSLGAINGGTAFYSSMDEQDIVLNLMNEGYLSQEGIHFVVGQKDCLSELGIVRKGSKAQSWESSDLKYILDGSYINAYPELFRIIFKTFLVKTSYSNGVIVEGEHKAAIFATKEVFGEQLNTNYVESSQLLQIKYYETSVNRIKKIGINGSAYEWWLRSPNTNSYSYCSVKSDGSNNYDGKSSSTWLGISPFMCI